MSARFFSNILSLSTGLRRRKGEKKSEIKKKKEKENENENENEKNNNYYFKLKIPRTEVSLHGIIFLKFKRGIKTMNPKEKSLVMWFVWLVLFSESI